MQFILVRRELEAILTRSKCILLEFGYLMLYHYSPVL